MGCYHTFGSWLKAQAPKGFTVREAPGGYRVVTTTPRDDLVADLARDFVRSKDIKTLAGLRTAVDGWERVYRRRAGLDADGGPALALREALAEFREQRRPLAVFPWPGPKRRMWPPSPPSPLMQATGEAALQAIRDRGRETAPA